jgi:trk system potassium uptake protein TrkA
MKVFIVGAGEVGTHIASALCEEGHDLVIIERDQQKVRDLQAQLDVLAVRGDGCNSQILEAHGIERADLFFAVSNDDAANLLAALTARRMGAPRCIVRVGRPYHGRNPLLKADPEIQALYPERLVAEEIQGLTRVPGATKAHFFADRKLALVKAQPAPTAPIYGRALRELEGPEGWILTGIRREETTIIPRGDTRLEEGDLVYAVGNTATAQEFLASIGVDSRPTRRVVIAGGGHVGYWLSRVLVKDHIDVTVIQRGARRAFDLAAEVPEVLVLQGDATDPAMLREAGVDEADYFVSATQDTETNILSSLLARELGAKREVVLYHKPEFLDVLKAVKAALPLSPRLMIAGRILRMVHRREIVNLDVVEGGDAEVVEFKVPSNAKVLKQPLAQLSFPKSSIVGAVLRGKDLFVPRGTFQFKAKDRALVFTLTDTLPALEKMFRER